MRKKTFLFLTIAIAVLVLILAFENIFYVQQFYFFFWNFNSSTTVMILLAAILGFLVGFFAMLYSHEVRREREMQKDEEVVSEAPVKTVEEKPAPEVSKEEQAAAADDFDEDDEVLG